MSIALFIVVNFVAVDLYVFPQTHTFPFSSNAIVLFVPADIFTIFSSGFPFCFITWTGVFLLEDVPSPNWPYPLYPKLHTVPSSFTTTVL